MSRKKWSSFFSIVSHSSALERELVSRQGSRERPRPLVGLTRRDSHCSVRSTPVARLLLHFKATIKLVSVCLRGLKLPHTRFRRTHSARTLLLHTSTPLCLSLSHAHALSSPRHKNHQLSRYHTSFECLPHLKPTPPACFRSRTPSCRCVLARPRTEPQRAWPARGQSTACTIQRPQNTTDSIAPRNVGSHCET